MLSFSQHNKLLIEEEATYGLTLMEFHSLGLLTEEEVMKLKDLPAATPKEGNPWHKVRAGASHYFSAPPEQQKAIYKDALVKDPHKLTGTGDSNAKLAKSGKKLPEFKSLGVSLAPSTLSGRDVCPSSTPECRAACLGVTAGKVKQFPTMINGARIRKTDQFFDHPHHFYAKLDHEITSAKKSAAKEGKKLSVRLNVLSDIPHEHLAPELFKKHSDVQFMDYTKIPGRIKHTPSNYHLTMSSAGVDHPDSNWKHVKKHLDAGGVASMVFGQHRGELPTHVQDTTTGKHYKVIDGDEHDLRFMDHHVHDIPHGEGIIAGLRLKGGDLERAGNFAVKTGGQKVVKATY